MKAIAKHNCAVTLTTSLEILSLNRMNVKKGFVFDLPVHKDEKLKSAPIVKLLGDRTVVFQDGIWLIPTYARDFNYVEE